MKRFINGFSFIFLLTSLLFSCSNGLMTMNVSSEVRVSIPKSRNALEDSLTVEVIDIKNESILRSKTISITDEKDSYTVTIDEIPVGKEVVINAIVKNKEGDVSYVGSSEVFTVRSGMNTVSSITLSVPQSCVTVKIDKSKMIGTEYLEGYGNPVEIKWTYYIDNVMKKEEIQNEDLLEEEKVYKGLSSKLGLHDFKVEAEIKYDKGQYLRYTFKKDTYKVIYDSNEIILEYSHKDELPVTTGHITITSNGATPTVEHPLSITYLDPSLSQARSISVTSLPHTIFWCEEGEYSFTEVKSDNKEETIRLNSSKVRVSDGGEATIEIIGEPNKVYYVAEKGSDTNKGTKSSPYATVSGIINKIENQSGFTFNNTSAKDNHHFVVNVSGNIQEKERIEIQKGYEITIQGTKDSPATITAINSNGVGEANHGVMKINENIGYQQWDFQRPTVVNLKYITLTGGVTGESDSDRGGICITKGTLNLGEGVRVTGNSFSSSGDIKQGNGIFIDGQKYESGVSNGKLVLKGDATVSDYVYVLNHTPETSSSELIYRPDTIELKDDYTGTIKLNTFGLEYSYVTYDNLPLIKGVNIDNVDQIQYNPDAKETINENGELIVKK